MMNKFLTVAVAALAILVAGCAGTYSKDYAVYAKSEALRPLPEKKPLFKLTAQEGQSITGLASIEVYAPDDAGAQAANRIAPPIPQEPMALQVAKIAIGGLVGLAGPAGQVLVGNQQKQLGIAQSNNATALGIAQGAAQTRAAESANAMLGNIFGAAVTSNTNIATAGFGANATISGQGFAAATSLGNNIQGTATAGFASNTTIAGAGLAALGNTSTAAFGVMRDLGMRPTTQVTGDGNNLITGTGNTTQSGTGNRQGSSGPCTAGNGGNPTGTATTTPAATTTPPPATSPPGVVTATPTTTGGSSDCAK